MNFRPAPLSAAFIFLSAASLLLSAPSSARNAGMKAVPAGIHAPASKAPVKKNPVVPPATWREHWFEHRQLLKRAAYNDDVALYFDDDVNRAETGWILPFMTRLWRYTKATYGSFGPEGRLYAVFHQGKYSGGHPSTYFDASHDYRDVIDCGPGPWGPTNIDIPSHEVGHIVEGASNNVHGSPAFGLWGDSKWNEFYQYDAYRALGMDTDAQRLLDRFSSHADNFPRANSYWFRDWYYPLWRDHGHAQVMVRFFKLLTQYYPKKQEGDDHHLTYSRDMNWGDYVHFMSGAAGVDLKPLATKAFGWPAEWDDLYRKARAEFPQIKYKTRNG